MPPPPFLQLNPSKEAKLKKFQRINFILIRFFATEIRIRNSIIVYSSIVGLS